MRVESSRSADGGSEQTTARTTTPLAHLTLDIGDLFRQRRRLILRLSLGLFDQGDFFAGQGGEPGIRGGAVFHINDTSSGVSP